MKKIWLLDIENCPQTSQNIKKLLIQYDLIFVVYLTSNVSFLLHAIYSLIPYIKADKFNLIKIPIAGRSSADFGLTYIAGQLSQKYQADEYTFDVMSNDHTTEYVVELLRLNRFNKN